MSVVMLRGMFKSAMRFNIFVGLLRNFYFKSAEKTMTRIQICSTSLQTEENVHLIYYHFVMPLSRKEEPEYNIHH